MPRKSIRSVARAFTLLKAFDSAEEWVLLKDLTSRTGLPEPTAYRIISTLVETGAVEKGSTGYRCKVAWREAQEQFACEG